MEIVWSELAWEDLQAIVLFIARDSTVYAEEFGVALHAKAETLSTLPARGRSVPEFSDTAIRELFHQTYRILYRLETHRVLVIAIIHGSRDLNSLWRHEGRGEPGSITG